MKHRCFGLLAGCFAMFSMPAVAYDCQDFANDLSKHLDKSGSQTVEAQMSAAKKRTNHSVHSSFGNASRKTSAKIGDRFYLDFVMTFSDRNNFDPSQTDKQRLYIYPNGNFEVVLTSWGNTRLWLEDVSCHAGGIVTGHLQEGNGKSEVNLAINLK